MKLKRITPEEIAEYGVVNAPDKLVGNPHDNKMIFDRLIREVVAGAINALIDQWEELDEAEDQRDEAEEQREAAEQARQEAENLRQNTFREEIEEAKGHEEGAYRAMNLAAENAHWSEAFAVGKENGVDIDSTNPAYRNNAKFYAEQARNVVGGDDVFVCPNILVSAADWSASTKYDDFPWEATAKVKDINGQHVPFVVFDHVDAATYGLATVADTADERLTIYSVTMPERDILIPVTVFMSEGAIQSAWKALSGGKEGEVLAKQSGKDHDFKWMPISGLGAGLDGERGLAIYRANKPWSEWTSEYFDFDDFILPADYKPKPNDLVLTSNNYLCWIYSVDENAREAVVASFMPAVSLNGGPGPAGDPGESPNISILPGERDEEDGTVRYGTVIEVTNPDGSKVYAFVPDGKDGDPGPAGADGKDGKDGKDGEPGKDGQDGEPGPAGTDGKDGKDGADGIQGERGLAIYRCSQAMYGMTSDTIDFTKFQLPVGYVPKVNDLVITADNYLYYVYEVNVTTDAITLASFYPPVNLNGAEGPAGPAGADGEKGDTGERGTGILVVTTTPSTYTTEINGLTPAYRIALSTVTTQAKVSKVLVGDIVQRSYYHYPVIYVDGSYVYCGTRVSIRGATGAAGEAGTPGEPGEKGDPGEKGEPGDTPYIGANGNWWIGGTDTGVAATGSGSGGASVQADWGENDETKLSHVKGRTHWKEQIGGDEIVPETTKTFDGYYVTIGGSKLGIVEGIAYIVQFNGEEYTVVGQNYKGDMIVGNARLIDADGEDTEEPFVITWIGGTSYYLTRRKSNPRTLTVSVNSKKVVIYHKLDHGYLPVNEQKTITWDGVVKDGDLVIRQMVDAERYMAHIKVSDLTPTIEDVLGGVVWLGTIAGDFGSVSIKASFVTDTAWGDGFEISYNEIAGSLVDGFPDEISTRGEIVVVHSPSVDAAALGVVPGIYFGFSRTDQIRTLSYGNENRIDSKVLPAGYGSVTKSVELLPETTFVDGAIIPPEPITLTPYKSYRIVFGGVTYYATAFPFIMEGMNLGTAIGLPGNESFYTGNIPVSVVSVYPEYVEMLGVECLIQMNNFIFYNQATISIWDDTCAPISPVANPRLIVYLRDFVESEYSDNYFATTDIPLDEIFSAVMMGVDVEVRALIDIAGSAKGYVPFCVASFRETEIAFFARFGGEAYRVNMSLSEEAQSPITVSLPTGTSPVITGTSE